MNSNLDLTGFLQNTVRLAEEKGWSKVKIRLNRVCSILFSLVAFPGGTTLYVVERIGIDDWENKVSAWSDQNIMPFFKDIRWYMISKWRKEYVNQLDNYTEMIFEPSTYSPYGGRKRT